MSLPTYSINDLNMLNYLSQRSIIYELNMMMNNLKTSNKVESLSVTLLSNINIKLSNNQNPIVTKRYFDNLYLGTALNNTGISGVSYNTCTWKFNSSGTSVITVDKPTVNTGYTINLYAISNELTLFRTFLTTSQTSSTLPPPTTIQTISNLSYPDIYLSNPEIFTTRLVYQEGDKSSDTQEISFLTYISKVAPKIFLEICNSYVNTFIVKLFKDYKSVDGVDKSIPSPQTENTINSWCINAMCGNNTSCIDNVCSLDKSNIRCACQQCYNNHSYQNTIIGNEMLNSDSVDDSSPWCIYPNCASGLAFKNNLNLERSICSNISVSGIFVNPNDYSNINISNTKVSSSSFNDNGINIISGNTCDSCTQQGKDCNIVGSTLTCVDKPPKDNKNLNKNSGSSLLKTSGKSNTYKILMIISGSILFFLIILKIMLHKHKIINYINNLVIIIDICLVILFLVLFLNSKETYKYPDIIVNDPTSCSQINLCPNIKCPDNLDCLFNECKVPIGKFLSSTKSFIDFPVYNSTTVFDVIIDNLPYLPFSLFTGTYIYSTIIDNEIYAIAYNCNFKFNGEKWTEIPRKSLQTGFTPNSPNQKNMVDKSTLLLNYSSNSIVTYNNTIYSMSGTGLDVDFNKFNTITNLWSVNSYNLKITTSNTQSPKSYKLFLIFNNIIYIFGGNDNGFNINNLFSINLSDNTTSCCPIGDIVVNQWSYTFVYNNKIYICNMTIGDDSSKGLNIYQMIPPQFKADQKCNDSDTQCTFVKFLTIPIGSYNGRILYYFDDIYLIIINGLHYYKVNMSNSSVSPTLSLSISIKPEVSFFNQTFPLVYSDCFKLNGYLFIITDSGEIFRLYEGKTNTVYINPCYGISNFDSPLDQQIIQL